MHPVVLDVAVQRDVVRHEDVDGVALDALLLLLLLVILQREPRGPAPLARRVAVGNLLSWAISPEQECGCGVGWGGVGRVGWRPESI